MALTLHIGVIDVPYSENEPNKKVAQAKKGKNNKPVQNSSGIIKTTGDIAEILEEKYHVMQTFADMNIHKITAALENSMAGSLEDLILGAPKKANPFKSAESEIAQLFKHFLESGEIEHAGIEGVPTEAALRGVNHRLVHPYVKSNPRRESFIDTGMYQQSATAWID